MGFSRANEQSGLSNMQYFALISITDSESDSNKKDILWNHPYSWGTKVCLSWVTLANEFASPRKYIWYNYSNIYLRNRTWYQRHYFHMNQNILATHKLWPLRIKKKSTVVHVALSHLRDFKFYISLNTKYLRLSNVILR